MINLSVRLMEMDDTELEHFIELWVDAKSFGYTLVERLGQANDKGRDVIGFLSRARHEGAWHLYQCKRKTRGSKLGRTEGLVELAKIFHHNVDGAYDTLPTKYVFVAPRGIAGPFLDLLKHPKKLKQALLDDWDAHCSKAITSRSTIALSPEIRAAIEGYGFEQVEYLTASLLAKDPASGPALSKILGLVPDEAPAGAAPVEVQTEELVYVEQLRQVYEEKSGAPFASADEILRHDEHGEHFRDQRTRFFEAAAFRRFHRDNTAPDALVSFESDIYHSVVDVHRQPHPSKLERVNAVMRHASIISADLRGRSVRPPVRQGICHHLVNDGRLVWSP